MRAYVLPDPRLVKLAGRFVWLSIDTENPKNLPFVERFPIDAWPTLLVIDPDSEAVVVRWAGTATAVDIEKLALDGERSVKPAGASKADTLLVRADRLLGAREHAKAAASYAEALAAGGPAWRGRERAIEARVQALSMTDDMAGCAEAARTSAPAVTTAAIAARIVAQGLACAEDLPAPAGPQTVAMLESQARTLVRGPGVLADDRSWLYEKIADARKAAGDAKGEKDVAREWLAYLEGEAARGKTPLERAAFNGQRVSAARRLGEPERVLPALKRSEQELPGEFVVPSLLGVVYLDMNRPADALAAADRALALAQGPRRVRVMVLKAEAQLKLDRRADARATLEKALSEGEMLPDNAKPTGYMKKARKMLAEI